MADDDKWGAAVVVVEHPRRSTDQDGMGGERKATEVFVADHTMTAKNAVEADANVMTWLQRFETIETMILK